jgi:SAM-dependent methyltransferase
MIPSVWDATDAVQDRHWWFVARRGIIASVLQRKLPAGARVLDVGCGTGFVLDALRDRFEVTGLEPEASVRARAHRSIAPLIAPGSAFELEAAGSRPFDAILMLDVLEHIADDVGALRNVLGRLTPGGFLLLTVPAYPMLWSRHDVDHGHQRRYTRSLLRHTVAAAGGDIEHLTNFNARLFPLALLNRLAGSYSAGLKLPPPLANRMLTRIFAGEARHLERGYPVGLSLMGRLRRVDAGSTPP